MIAGVALIMTSSQNEAMTAFAFFVGIALAIGLLSLRYGVDSRRDERQL
jgi:uncharacterized protein involved in exopolysaccharide biosynthesis